MGYNLKSINTFATKFLKQKVNKAGHMSWLNDLSTMLRGHDGWKEINHEWTSQFDCSAMTATF